MNGHFSARGIAPKWYSVCRVEMLMWRKIEDMVGCCNGLLDNYELGTWQLDPLSQWSDIHWHQLLKPGQCHHKSYNPLVESGSLSDIMTTSSNIQPSLCRLLSLLYNPFYSFQDWWQISRHELPLHGRLRRQRILLRRDRHPPRDPQGNHLFYVFSLGRVRIPQWRDWGLHLCRVRIQHCLDPSSDVMIG